MLVAEKQNDIYEEYLPRIHKEYEVPQQGRRAVHKPKVRSRLLPILGVFIGFAVCTFILSRYVLISVQNSEINQLKKALVDEQKKTEGLKFDLMMADNLDYIKKTAKTKLGMDFPQHDEVKYVTLPSDKKVASKEQKVSQNSENGILDKIYGLLD